MSLPLESSRLEAEVSFDLSFLSLSLRGTRAPETGREVGGVAGDLDASSFRLSLEREGAIVFDLP